MVGSIFNPLPEFLHPSIQPCSGRGGWWRERTNAHAAWRGRPSRSFFLRAMSISDKRSQSASRDRPRLGHSGLCGANQNSGCRISRKAKRALDFQCAQGACHHASFAFRKSGPRCAQAWSSAKAPENGHFIPERPKVHELLQTPMRCSPRQRHPQRNGRAGVTVGIPESAVDNTCSPANPILRKIAQDGGRERACAALECLTSVYPETSAPASASSRGCPL